MTAAGQGRKLQAGARRVWRHVRDEGGWWSLDELAAALPDQQPRLVSRLRRLADSGYLVRRKPSAADVTTYGFTSACRVPDGEIGVPAVLAHTGGKS